MGLDCCTVAEPAEQSPGIRVSQQTALRSQTIAEDGIQRLGSVNTQDQPEDDDIQISHNKRSMSTPLKRPIQGFMAPPPELPKFTEGKLASPMVAIVRTSSLLSFQDKRKELSGNVNLGNVISQQRRAAKIKQEETKKKEEARVIKQKMIVGRKTLIIYENDEEEYEESEEDPDDPCAALKASMRVKLEDVQEGDEDGEFEGGPVEE